jgi:hypothetical protein
MQVPWQLMQRSLSAYYHLSNFFDECNIAEYTVTPRPTDATLLAPANKFFGILIIPDDDFLGYGR